jgi:broad-specificity NMP kinase
MERKFLITGVSGTGKSTVCKRLQELGYEAADIENIEGLFGMYHKGTRKEFENYSNANPENIKNAEWICDVQKLKTILKKQKREIAFYSGIASNIDEITPLFDKVFVLQLSSRDLNERLKVREGTEDIGNIQEGRDVILGWKDWWEEKMKNNDAVFIDATPSPTEIARKIISFL